MDLDQLVIVAGFTVACSIVCAIAAVLLPMGDRFDRIVEQDLPAPRIAQHASTAQVDTPTGGIHHPAPAHTPDTIGIDGLIARPYIPPIVIDGPRSAHGLLPYDGLVERIPQCSLCKDGMHVIGAVCIICGALPIMPEVRS